MWLVGTWDDPHVHFYAPVALFVISQDRNQQQLGWRAWSQNRPLGTQLSASRNTQGPHSLENLPKVKGTAKNRTGQKPNPAEKTVYLVKWQLACCLLRAKLSGHLALMVTYTTSLTEPERESRRQNNHCEPAFPGGGGTVSVMLGLQWTRVQSRR